MREYSLQTGVPVVQVHLHPWQIFQNHSSGGEANHSIHGKGHSYTELIRSKSLSNDNYAVLIPAYIVMDNILEELIPALNITSELVIIHDSHYGTQLDLTLPTIT